MKVLNNVVIGMERDNNGAGAICDHSSSLGFLHRIDFYQIICLMRDQELHRGNVNLISTIKIIPHAGEADHESGDMQVRR